MSSAIKYIYFDRDFTVELILKDKRGKSLLVILKDEEERLSMNKEIKYSEKHGNGFKDLTGLRFGKLRVLNYAYTKGKRAYWNCLCDCGKLTIVQGTKLNTGSTKSCGCLRIDIARVHGMNETKLYKVWTSMKQRCLCESSQVYSYYGGRGIKLYPDWYTFINFYNWAMENGYEEGLSIDRIDNNGNYEPSNCRWVSRFTQMKNTRKNVYITYNNETHHIAEWARKANLYRATIGRRYKLGWSLDRVFKGARWEN